MFNCNETKLITCHSLIATELKADEKFGDGKLYRLLQCYEMKQVLPTALI